MDKPMREFERGFELGRTRIVKGHGLYLRLPIAERLRAARGVPQAVVKVTGFGRGLKGVRDAMAYISRDGALPLEKHTGDLIEGLEAQRELVNEWSIDFDGKRHSRDSAQIVFSMPPGSNVEALKAAVRATGSKAFPDNEWVFGIHTDTKHPHAHLVVKMRGRENGKKLGLKKADLFKLRTLFAETAREQGVELAASPRAARGVGRKAVRQTIHQLKQKGIKPDVHKQTAREALEEYQRNDWKKKPWEMAMAERNKLEREAYRQDARTLREEAEKCHEAHERERLLKEAVELERFSQTMREPTTKRAAMKRWLYQESLKRQREIERKNQRDSGLER